MRNLLFHLFFCFCFLSCVSSSIDVTNAGGNSGPSKSELDAPYPSIKLYIVRDIVTMLAIIIVPLFCCFLCCRLGKSDNANKARSPVFCDSFLKAISLLFAIPLLYSAFRYNLVLSRVKFHGASGKYNGNVLCSLQHWDPFQPMIRGEWTFTEDATNENCCHPKNLQMTIDDELFEDAYYLKGENWEGDSCPHGLLYHNELPITFNAGETFLAKFKAADFDSTPYIDASDAWWDCTPEGAKIFYKLNFIRNGIECSRTITKAGGEPVFFHQTSLIISILMAAILGLYASFRVIKVCVTSEDEADYEDEIVKNDYNQNVAL